jgi:hypothetical protein
MKTFKIIEEQLRPFKLISYEATDKEGVVTTGTIRVKNDGTDATKLSVAKQQKLVGDAILAMTPKPLTEDQLTERAERLAFRESMKDMSPMERRDFRRAKRDVRVAKSPKQEPKNKTK